MPETDSDLIDTRDFHVYSVDKSEEFPLSSKLKNIHCLSSASLEDPPTLCLESSIFRSAVEVDIDSRIKRRRETVSSRLVCKSCFVPCHHFLLCI